MNTLTDYLCSLKETGAKTEHFRQRVKRGAVAMASMRKIHRAPTILVTTE